MSLLIALADAGLVAVPFVPNSQDENEAIEAARLVMVVQVEKTEEDGQAAPFALPYAVSGHEGMVWENLASELDKLEKRRLIDIVSERPALAHAKSGNIASAGETITSGLIDLLSSKELLASGLRSPDPLRAAPRSLPEASYPRWRNGTSVLSAPDAVALLPSPSLRDVLFPTPADAKLFAKAKALAESQVSSWFDFDQDAYDRGNDAPPAEETSPCAVLIPFLDTLFQRVSQFPDDLALAYSTFSLHQVGSYILGHAGCCRSHVATGFSDFLHTVVGSSSDEYAQTGRRPKWRQLTE